MSQTFIDVLLQLPADTTLRTFLQANGLPLPNDLVPEPVPEASKALIDALRAWPDVAARDRLIGKLMSSVQLVEPSGRRAMFQVAAGTGSALMGMVACTSDLHRSFWLYVHHPHLFDQACDLDYLDRHRSRAQQFDLGVKSRPNISEAAVANLRQAIADFYQRELQCGDASAAYLVECRPGVYLLSVHVKDLAALRLEFDGPTLTRRVGHPNIHMVLEYASATGVARTMVRGGEKYHRMLVDAFAEHLLGGRVESIRLKRQVLDLSALRHGFNVPQAMADGFVAAHVKSITFTDHDETLRLKFDARIRRGRRDVADLLRQHFPQAVQSPRADDWRVTAASVSLYYPPKLGQIRSRVVTIELTSDGGTNLHKFDASLQRQLEGYLVELGVLRPGQTFQTPTAQTADPAPTTVAGGQA